MMEFHDQEMLKDQTHMILKGKRTKRQRPMSPLVFTMATTISSSSSGVIAGDDDGGFCDLNLSCGGGGGRGVDHFTVTTSSSDSGEFIQNTLDEEDMANCLILLAQGRHHQQSQRPSKQINLAMSDHAKVAVPEVYGCKTCNRHFPTFQALGGHRASHRKPKLALEDKKSSTESSILEKSNNTCSNSNTNNKSRVHECLICGAEFSSGQALGGHMRRHRPLPVAAVGASSHDDDSQEVKKSKLELLGLDLNLPAPEDIDPRGSKFSFASKDQVPVYVTSQLVDCHY